MEVLTDWDGTFGASPGGAGISVDGFAIGLDVSADVLAALAGIFGVSVGGLGISLEALGVVSTGTSTGIFGASVGGFVRVSTGADLSVVCLVDDSDGTELLVVCIAAV